MDHNSSVVRSYVLTYLALMALLAATVGAAYINLGRWNLPLTLTIATVKAGLVIVFFMHIRETVRLIWLYALLSLVFIGYLFGGTLFDLLTRG